MQIYLKKGIVIDTDHFNIQYGDFYIQATRDYCTEKYVYPGDSIKYKLDSELVSLYDTLRDAFFESTEEYYHELDLTPIFVQAAGQDSDCALTADEFAQCIQESSFTQLPNCYRHLYLVDCQFLVGSIQNLLVSMEDIFCDFYVRITTLGKSISPSKPNVVMMESSSNVISLVSLLETYFVKAYSILDRFCKIAYELEYPMADFEKYKKMKSAKVLWGDRKRLSINHQPGTVFEECELIDTIESLRNEVVHNGSWELHPQLFVTYQEGEIVERYLLFPDIDQGHLACVKNRKHFFGSNNKVNERLWQIHSEFAKRVLATAEYINKKYWN